MTAKETIKLERLDVKVDNAIEEMGDIKDDIKEIKHMLQKQENKFVLRREAAVAMASLTSIIAVIGLYVALKG